MYTGGINSKFKGGSGWYESQKVKAGVIRSRKEANPVAGCWVWHCCTCRAGVQLVL